MNSLLKWLALIIPILGMEGCAQREHVAAQTYNLSPVVRPRESEPLVLHLVRADRYTLFEDAFLLPDDIRAALAREFGEETLEMASGVEPFNGGCLLQPGLPRRRLLLVAVSPRFAVVHFEVGGFAVANEVLVFQRAARRRQRGGDENLGEPCDNRLG